MSVDWFFAPTDNINLLIEVLIGLTVTAWIAGRRAKEALVAYLLSNASDAVIDKLAERSAARVLSKIPRYPVPPTVEQVAVAVGKQLPHIPTVAEVAAAVQDGFPEVPTVAQVAAAVKSELPEYPNLDTRLSLLEERLGGKIGPLIAENLNARFPEFREAIRVQVRETLQANIASMKHEYAAGTKELDDAADGDLGTAGELAELIGMDKESIRKLGRAKRGIKMLQERQRLKELAKNGGGGGQIPLFTEGQQFTNPLGTWTVVGGKWVLTAPAPATALPAAPAAVVGIPVPPAPPTPAPPPPAPILMAAAPSAPPADLSDDLPPPAPPKPS